MTWTCKLCGDKLEDEDFWNHMFDDHESEDIKMMLANYSDELYPFMWENLDD